MNKAEDDACSSNTTCPFVYEHCHIDNVVKTVRLYTTRWAAKLRTQASRMARCSFAQAQIEGELARNKSAAEVEALRTARHDERKRIKRAERRMAEASRILVRLGEMLSEASLLQEKLNASAEHPGSFTLILADTSYSGPYYERDELMRLEPKVDSEIRK